jgi:hypothetical protein
VATVAEAAPGEGGPDEAGADGEGVTGRAVSVLAAGTGAGLPTFPATTPTVMTAAAASPATEALSTVRLFRRPSGRACEAEARPASSVKARIPPSAPGTPPGAGTADK